MGKSGKSFKGSLTWNNPKERARRRYRVMVEEMGMTNKQFQGFIRLALGWIEKALEESPNNESLKSLKDIFQSMLEDA